MSKNENEEQNDALAPSGLANPDIFAGPDQFADPVYAQPQPAIVNVQQNVTQLPDFQHDSIFCKCPWCGHEGMTVLKKKIGQTAFVMSFFICILMAWPCFWVPFCIDMWKDTHHYCGGCQQKMGENKGGYN